MFLKETANPDAEPVHMDWDQAQAALRSGGYEIHSEGLMEDASTRSEPLVPNLPKPPEPEKKPEPAPAPAPAPAAKGKSA